VKWVAASGARGLHTLTIDLGEAAARRYVVRLHFREPDGLPAGRRLFDVSLQGKPVEAGLDVAQAAGGPNRPLVREYRSVGVRRELTVTLRPAPGAAVPEPVLSGVEVQAEGW
jgi:hypothetical protein